MLKQPQSSFARIPYAQRCRLWRGGRVQDGVLCNVSLLGVYVTLEDIPAVGEEVRLSFPLPADEGGPIEAAAVVTWRTREEPPKASGLPSGCGLRFVSLRPRESARLRAVIDEYGDGLPYGIGAEVPHSAYVRVPYVQRGKLTEGAATRAAVVCNLSTLGAYVSVDPLPARDARVEIAFLLPGDAQTFRGRATVTWQNPEGSPRVDSLAPGCGLRFDDLSHEDRMRLSRVVRDYRAGSAPAD
jgi:PilZ domain